MVSDRQVRWRTHVIRAFARRFMSKYTAGTLVYVQDSAGRVALVEPRRAKGQWTFPGGFHRRPFEDPEEAGIRELKEELCLSIRNGLQEIDLYRQHNRRHYDHLYFCRLELAQPEIRRRPRRFWVWVEVKSVRWVDISDPDIREALVEEARAALTIYENALAVGVGQI